MASPDSLGDFFAKKNTKKKVKAVNLNKEPGTAPADAAKPKRRGEDAEWQEEEEPGSHAEHAIIGVAGKLENEEEKTEEASTAAWGSVKVAASLDKTQERRYPTLQRSMVHPSNVDNNNQAAISVAKNHFSALGGDEGDDDDAKKTSSQMKVGKKKGEFIIAKDTGVAKKKTSKKKGKDSSEEESEGDDQPPAAPQVKVEREETTPSESPDLLIKEDLDAAKAKYAGRRKLPSKEIAAFDQKDKENRPVAKSGKKAVNLNFEEELDSKKLQYVDA